MAHAHGEPVAVAPDARVDLHIHSSASDGELDPAAVVAAAVAGGLQVIALADHDTTAGVPSAQRAALPGLRIIPAVELSTTSQGSERHILGYHIDPEHPRLLEHAAVARSQRRDRVRRILDRLGDAGVQLALEEVEREADASAAPLGRPHVARALVARGYARTVADAFDRWLGDSGPAFVPTDILTPAQAIELIHSAGGLAIWAHPAPEQLQLELDTLAAEGLDGVECYRPRVEPADAERAAALARDRHLLVSGGSDWHGAWHGPLGSFAVTAAQVTALLAAAGR
ncbi:MAG: PHP domain-containing protein [Longimicrobiales bacterium]